MGPHPSSARRTGNDGEYDAPTSTESPMTVTGPKGPGSVISICSTTNPPAATGRADPVTMNAIAHATITRNALRRIMHAMMPS
jgi:hypothetical protein